MGNNNKDEEFRFPFSSFVGSRIGNFLQIAFRCGFDLKYTRRAILSLIIAIILEPFRWINRGIRYFTMPRGKKAAPPWFIIGYWRSGTTLMHQLLSEDPEFYFVSTFQTIFPELMFFQRPLKWVVQFFMPQRRPVDHLRLSLDDAQEEEIALANLFPYSFYHFLYFPIDYKNARDRSLYLDRMSPKRRRRWLSVYNRMILDAQKNKGGKRLLSKSPANTFRIEYLKEYYPDSKFIYLYRDPYSVLSSLNLFFTEVVKGVGFREIPNDEFNRCLLDLFIRMDEEYEKVKDDIGAENLIEIRFEDFIKSPLDTILNIYEQFGEITSDEVVKKIKERLSEYKGHKPGHYSIPPEIISLVNENLEDYLSKRGYGIVGSRQ